MMDAMLPGTESSERKEVSVQSFSVKDYCLVNVFDTIQNSPEFFAMHSSIDEQPYKLGQCLFIRD
jgi:hypothetical protein